MRAPPMRTRLLPLIALAIALPACSTMKSVVDAIPRPSMPHLSMPKLSSVKKLIPDFGTPREDDPAVPYTPGATLGYGHTLRLAVYGGIRNATKLWSGTAMVDRDGVLTLGDVGSARVGGRSPLQARDMIAAAFRAAGRSASKIHVQLFSIEGNDMITVEGDVAHPAIVPYQEGLTTSQLIAAAGGRRTPSAQSVYVTQAGQRRFFLSEAYADANADLEAGDIVQPSADL
jgi:protein involved in polysaccharide export with SLBB domain